MLDDRDGWHGGDWTAGSARRGVAAGTGRAEEGAAGAVQHGGEEWRGLAEGIGRRGGGSGGDGSTDGASLLVV